MYEAIRGIRRRLGSVRHAVLHGRADRLLAQEADVACAGWIAQATADLPSLPAPSDVTGEVHTLCGQGQFVMGLWASWSLMRFLPNARLVVHSDGSLTQDSKDRWAALIPGLRMIERADGLTRLDTHLADFPEVRTWTRDYHFGFKLGGLHALVETPRLIDMDTDVLTLARPADVCDIMAGNDAQMAWNQDVRQALAYPEPLLRELIPHELGRFPDKLNGGFMVMERLTKDEWQLFEDVIIALKKDDRTDHLRYWMHQTMFAVLASTRGTGAGPLPAEYDIYMGPTRAGSCVRHYVGNPSVRPRLFTEGVAQVIRDARQRGQLPT